MLAVLIGVIVGGALGFIAFTRKGSSGSANTASTPITTAANIVGVVSFTSTGALKGAFTINLPRGSAPASYIQKGSSANVLEAVVHNASMSFELVLSPYPGPGSYTLLPSQTTLPAGSFSGAMIITSNQTSWSLHPSATCKVTITADTPLNSKAQGKPLHDVKGSFACPKLAADTGSASITVTQGQFEVYAEAISL